MITKDNISATSLIVSLSFSPSKKDAVLIVGKKEPGKDVEVVNAFDGDNALAIYELLTQLIDDEDGKKLC